MRFFRLGTAGWGRTVFALAGAALSWTVAAPAMAQVPVPPSSEAAAIASCLCLQRAVDAGAAAMTERQGAYEASRREVTDLDAQLQSARMSLNVDNPEAVARFRQLLDRRDAALRRSSGPLFSGYSSAVSLYNDRVNQFNATCAHRPTNQLLLNQVQATLVCPPIP